MKPDDGTVFHGVIDKDALKDIKLPDVDIVELTYSAGAPDAIIFDEKTGTYKEIYFNFKKG